jgi:hypothetical protein
MYYLSFIKKMYRFVSQPSEYKKTKKPYKSRTEETGSFYTLFHSFLII